MTTSALTWTPTRPTVPGWYWLRPVGDDDEIVEVYPDDDLLWVECMGSRGGWSSPRPVTSPVLDGCLWAGPIPEPGR